MTRQGREWTEVSTRLRSTLTDQAGGAIILMLLVSVVVLGAGALALTVSRGEMRVSSNHLRGLSAKYHAESGLHRLVGMQNDLTASPRYLFNASNYSHRASSPSDTSLLIPHGADAPLTAGTRSVGSTAQRVIGKDPLIDPPPYRLWSTTTLSDGSSATFEALVDVLSLLDYAVFSDDDIRVAPNVTITGRVYSGDDITLTGPTSTFLSRVEYADQLENPSNGVFQQGHSQIPPLQSISALVNLNFFESASKNTGVCSAGRGLYVGFDGPGTVDNQTTNLFRAHRNGAPATQDASGSQAGCRANASCYLIDMTQFDFSASPITYGGTPVLGFDGTALTNFNGIIFADDELHVFGHLGGRFPEDATVTDTMSYMTPPFVAANLYSNHTLDVGEDGTNGGALDGLLDPDSLGVSLGLYSDETIWIDHNIWAGADSLGLPVRMALVSGDSVRIDHYSPRAIMAQTAVLAVNGTWRPGGTTGTHKPNDWAANAGDAGPGTYRFDLNQNGVLEANNGAAVFGDRNERAMRDAWTLYNQGNLVVAQRPSSSPWTSVSPAHPRFYRYDTQLVLSEIPCYPTLPDYGIVPGSFREVLSAP
jgi:hypothetical protein